MSSQTLCDRNVVISSQTMQKVGLGMRLVGAVTHFKATVHRSEFVSDGLLESSPVFEYARLEWLLQHLLDFSAAA